MNTFLKTFILCLVIGLGFYVYKYVMSESYSPDLKVSKENPVFAHQNKYDDYKEDDSQTLPIEDKLKDADKQLPSEKYEYICYFYSDSGKLIPVTREFAIKQSLENTVAMLLKGPTILEAKKGIYSEIPKNVDLINLRQTPDSVIVNLTSGFGQGGGSQSIENRVKQISKTVKHRVKNKKVYLYIDNKEVEYLGGEGVYIKQPLE